MKLTAISMNSHESAFTLKITKPWLINGLNGIADYLQTLIQSSLSILCAIDNPVKHADMVHAEIDRDGRTKS